MFVFTLGLEETSVHIYCSPLGGAVVLYLCIELFITLISIYLFPSFWLLYITHTHTVVYVWMSQLLYWLSGVQLWVNVRSVFVWIRSINQPPLVFYHGVVFILSEWYFLSHKSSHKPFCISTSSSRVKRASQTHYRWSHYGFCDHSSPLSDAPIGFNPPLNPLKQKKQVRWFLIGRFLRSFG